MPDRKWVPIQFMLTCALAFIQKHKKPAVALAVILIALATGALVFNSRSPVLVVTDAAFMGLYGKDRIQRQSIASSFALFRRVKPVITADGASPDILVTAVSETSRHPYCVLFPGYLAPSAERYHMEFPEVHTALFSGVSPSSDLPQSDGVLCVYRTDLETDLYRAGLFAGLIGLKRNPSDAQRISFLCQDRNIQAGEREFFSRGLSESDPGAVARFVNAASDIPGPEGISCVVLTSSGAEYLDRNAKIPLILFTWLDTSMLPAEIIAVFDDSAWAVAVPAVRMAVKSQAEGIIPSKPLVFSGESADNGIGRILRRLAKKTP